MPFLRTAVVVGATLVGVGWAATGSVLAWLRPRNRIGWVMLGVGALTQLSLTQESLARAGTPAPAGVVMDLVVGFSLYGMFGLLPAFYPTGRLPARAWVWPCLVVVAGAALMQWQWLTQVSTRQVSSPWTGESGWPWFPGTVFAVGVAAVWVLSVIRMLRSTFPERPQLIWLFGAVVVTLAAQFLGGSTRELFVQMLCLYALPVAVAVGIVRYRLLNIENVLRGELVYAVLTVAIIAVQVGLAAIVGSQLSGAVLAAVVAAGVVAVGLNPVRVRLQSVVDRFVHGRRTEPIDAVSDLGGLVASVGEEELLGEMPPVASVSDCAGICTTVWDRR